MELPEHKFLLKPQIIAFCDCIWSTYEIFSTSLTFFSSTNFNGFFQSDEKIIQVDFPSPEDGVQKTYMWSVLIFTLIVSFFWVDSSIQLLIGTRQIEKTRVEIGQCRYWLHLSFVLLFLFAFNTYSSTGRVSSFIFSCLAVFYRGLAMLIVHDEIHKSEKLLQGDDDYFPSSILQTPSAIRIHFHMNEYQPQRDAV